jgi:hypothetical protein
MTTISLFSVNDIFDNFHITTYLQVCQPINHTRRLLEPEALNIQESLRSPGPAPPNPNLSPLWDTLASGAQALPPPYALLMVLSSPGTLYI